MLRPIGPLFLVDTHKRLLIVCVLQNQNKAKILSKMTGFQKGIGEFPNLLSFFKFLGFGFVHFAKKNMEKLRNTYKTYILSYVFTKRYI